jgi:hypothetical protein
VKAGQLVVVDGTAYRVRHAMSMTRGVVRLEVSTPTARRARYLVRGKGLYFNRDLGHWRFSGAASVVELTR